MDEAERWLSVSEACKYLGVSKTTLYAYMKDGRLPFYHLAGRQRRVKKRDVDALLVLGKPEDLEEGCNDSNDEE